MISLRWREAIMSLMYYIFFRSLFQFVNRYYKWVEKSFYRLGNVEAWNN